MDETRRKAIGAVIRDLRKGLGLSRPELAARTATDAEPAISVEMIAKVEAGVKAPSERTLDRLALALGEQTSSITIRAAAREINDSGSDGLAYITPSVLGTVAAGGLLSLAGAPFVGLATAALLGTHVRDVAIKRRRRRTSDEQIHRDLDRALAKATPEEREQFAALLDTAARR